MYASTRLLQFSLSKEGSKSPSTRRGMMGQEECELCGQRVYLMERLAVENHVFHRACFKCHTCSTQLKPGSYEFDRNSDRFYCRTHYRDVLRQRTIKRTMEQRNLVSPPLNEGEREGETEGKHAPKRKKIPDTHPATRDKKNVVITATAESVVENGLPDSKTKEVEATPTEATLATPTSNISRQESAKIRSGLPTLLKTLAAAKQDTSSSPSPPVSPAKKDSTEMSQPVNIQDDPKSSGTVSTLGDAGTRLDSKVELQKPTELPAKSPPPMISELIGNGQVASGDVESTAELPQQTLSGKQLPGKQLVTDADKMGKLRMDEKQRLKIQEEKLAREREKERWKREEEGGKEEVWREGERKRREEEQEKERERRAREGEGLERWRSEEGKKEEKANGVAVQVADTTSSEDPPPVKPPRRRTKKLSASVTIRATTSENPPDKVSVAGEQIAVFNCYLFILMAVVIHCVLFNAYQLYVWLDQSMNNVQYIL